MERKDALFVNSKKNIYKNIYIFVCAMCRHLKKRHKVFIQQAEWKGNKQILFNSGLYSFVSVQEICSFIL